MSRKQQNSIRNSRTHQAPEQFVTVEIHNQTLKNKYRIHRSSVLSELRATESLLNQSLNKHPSIHQSGFLRLKRNSTSEKSFRIIPKPSSQKKKLITETSAVVDETENEQQYKMSPQIRQKFQQLGNISYQLEKACEPKKKDFSSFEVQGQSSYSLPVIEQSQPQKACPDSQEHLKAIKRWKQKVKLGKKCTQHLKENHVLYNLLKNARAQDQAQQVQATALRTPEQIRDTYTTALPQERKSAPINNSSTRFFNLFCSHKPEKQNLYDRKVQLEPLHDLEDFANGGEQSTYKDYSRYINLKQFSRTREKMTFLQRMYGYVKQKYAGNFKDMKEETLREPNLLSLVYYHQNNANLTEQQKKNLKGRLRFIQ